MLLHLPRRGGYEGWTEPPPGTHSQEQAGRGLQPQEFPSKVLGSRLDLGKAPSPVFLDSQTCHPCRPLLRGLEPWGATACPGSRLRTVSLLCGLRQVPQFLWASRCRPAVARWLLPVAHLRPWDLPCRPRGGCEGVLRGSQLCGCGCDLAGSRQEPSRHRPHSVFSALLPPLPGHWPSAHLTCSRPWPKGSRGRRAPACFLLPSLVVSGSSHGLHRAGC